VRWAEDGAAYGSDTDLTAHRVSVEVIRTVEEAL
jgi:hypothetical protein